MNTLHEPLPHPSETAHLPLIKSVRAFTRPREKADAVTVTPSTSGHAGSPKSASDPFLHPLQHLTSRKEVSRKNFSPRTAMLRRCEAGYPPHSSTISGQLAIVRPTRVVMNRNGYEEVQVLVKPSTSEKEEEIWMAEQLLEGNEDELDTGTSSFSYWNLQFMDPAGSRLKRTKMAPLYDARPAPLPSITGQTGKTYNTKSLDVNEDREMYLKIMAAIEKETHALHYVLMHVLYFDLQQKAYALLSEKVLVDQIPSAFRIIVEIASVQRRREQERAAKMKEITEANNFAHNTRKSAKSAEMYFDLQGAMERLGRRLEEIENAPSIENIHAGAPTVPRKAEVQTRAHRDLFMALNRESEERPRFMTKLEMKESMEALVDYLDGERSALLKREWEAREQLMREYDGTIQYLHGCREAQLVFEHIAKLKAEVARKVEAKEEASRKRQRLLISQVRAYTLNPSEYSTPRSCLGDEEEVERTARGPGIIDSYDFSDKLVNVEPLSVQNSSAQSGVCRESVATLDSVVTAPYGGPGSGISSRGPSVNGDKHEVLYTAPPSTTSIPRSISALKTSKNIALTSLSIALGNVWDIVSNPSDVDAAVRLDIADCLGVRVACIEVLPRLHDEVCDTVHLLVEHDGHRSDDELQDLISIYHFPNVLNLYEIFDNGRLIHEDRVSPSPVVKISVDRDDTTSSSSVRLEFEVSRSKDHSAVERSSPFEDSQKDNFLITASQDAEMDPTYDTMTTLQQAEAASRPASKKVTPLRDSKEFEAVTSAASQAAEALMADVMSEAGTATEGVGAATTAGSTYPATDTVVPLQPAPAEESASPREKSKSVSPSWSESRELDAMAAAALQAAVILVEHIMGQIVELSDVPDSPRPVEQTQTGGRDAALVPDDEEEDVPSQIAAGRVVSALVEELLLEHQEAVSELAAARVAAQLVDEVMSEEEAHSTIRVSSPSPRQGNETPLVDLIKSPSHSTKEDTDAAVKALREKDAEEALVSPGLHSLPLPDPTEEVDAIHSAASKAATELVDDLLSQAHVEKLPTEKPLASSSPSKAMEHPALVPVVPVLEKDPRDSIPESLRQQQEMEQQQSRSSSLQRCTPALLEQDEDEESAITAAASKATADLVEEIMCQWVELTHEDSAPADNVEQHELNHNRDPSPLLSLLKEELKEDPKDEWKAATLDQLHHPEDAEQQQLQQSSALQRSTSTDEGAVCAAASKAAADLVEEIMCQWVELTHRDATPEGMELEEEKEQQQPQPTLKEPFQPLSNPLEDEAVAAAAFKAAAALVEDVVKGIMGNQVDLQDAHSDSEEPVPHEENESKPRQTVSDPSASPEVPKIVGRYDTKLRRVIPCGEAVTTDPSPREGDDKTLAHQDDRLEANNSTSSALDAKAKELDAQLQPLLPQEERSEEEAVKRTAFYTAFQKLRKVKVEPDNTPFISYDDHLRQMSNRDLRAPVAVLPAPDSGRRLKGPGELAFLEDAAVVDPERLAAIGEETHMVVRRYHKLLPGEDWDVIFAARFDLFKQLFMTDFKEVTGCLCCIRNVIFSSRGCIVDMDYLHLRTQSAAYIHCVIDAGKFYRTQALYDNRARVTAPIPIEDAESPLDAGITATEELNVLLERAEQHMSNSLTAAENDLDTVAYMDFSRGAASPSRLAVQCHGLSALVGLEDPVLHHFDYKLDGDDWATLLRSCPRYLRDQVVGEVSTLLRVAPQCIRNVRFFADRKVGLMVTLDVLHERGTTQTVHQQLQSYHFPLVMALYQIRCELAKAPLDATLAPLTLLGFEYAERGTQAEPHEHDLSLSLDQNCPLSEGIALVPHPPAGTKPDKAVRRSR